MFQQKSNKINLKSTYIIFTLLIFAFFSYNSTAFANTIPRELTMQNYISVRDFGAKGDGVTDDSAAFQRAIDKASASNLKLLIPASQNFYLVKSSLQLRSNLQISKSFIFDFAAFLFFIIHKCNSCAYT